MDETNEDKKCHNCKGVGKVQGGNVRSDCYYCRGKGFRTKSYGRDD